MDIEQAIFEDPQESQLPAEILNMDAEGITTRNRMIDNEIRVLKEEANRLSLDLSGLKDRVKDNREKIKLNNQLPYLVANIVEVLEVSRLLTPPGGQHIVHCLSCGVLLHELPVC